MAEQSQGNVGSLSLKNDGAFLIHIGLAYQNGDGEWVREASGTGYPNPRTESVNPGDFGLPSGTVVTLWAEATGGSSTDQAKEEFVYQEGSTATAKYHITGVLNHLHLHYEGIHSSNG